MPQLPAAFSLLACVITLPIATGRPALDEAVAVRAERGDEGIVVSANALRGHVSFLASDLLEGRDTPSKGLDIAAEYVASQFRRIGLEPVGDDGYFQTSSIGTDDPSTASFSSVVRRPGGAITLTGEQMTVISAPNDVDVQDATVVWLPFAQPASTLAFDGPVVLVTDMPLPPRGNEEEQARDYFPRLTAFLVEARRLNAAAVLRIDPTSEYGRGPGQRGRLSRLSDVPIFTLHGGAIAAALPTDGEPRALAHDAATIDLKYVAPIRVETAVRNVVGLLRGSDDALAEECVIVSAHYDHVGVGAADDAGDAIYNGANDDASGTASLIEIAAALAAREGRPRRSILFIAVYGEERGLLGSRHYVEHPIVPLDRTIAAINLEHMGRTDDVEGESLRRLMPTGFDYSGVIPHFVEAGARSGVEVFHHPHNSASFFGRSDNVAFATAGIPAHTFCAGFIFPDYHQPGDHWDRIDYENMAGLAATIADGLTALANAAEPPSWNGDIRATRRFAEAWRLLHGLAEQEDAGEPVEMSDDAPER
jgi:hypothetical protein